MQINKMDNNVLTTSADELYNLVMSRKKISVEDASKILKLPMNVVQSLVDFLVEEKIFGIEYKFTTPYVYLYREGVSGAKEKEKGFTEGLITKEKFYERAKGKRVPYENIEGLWRKYLQQNLTLIREEFLRKAKEKKVSEEKTEELWAKYLSYL